MTKANECTCPSGDGSLRHPCPAHPAVEQAGEDERVIGWRERILAAHPNSDPGFWPNALLVEHMAAEIADLRAALAQPSPAQNGVDAFLGEVRAELTRARKLFPGDRIMTIALAEEFGELCKAILDEPSANVRREAVQTAVMAARVVLDGDGSVNDWRAAKGLDPLVKPALAAPEKPERFAEIRFQCDLEDGWLRADLPCGAVIERDHWGDLKAEIEAAVPGLPSIWADGQGWADKYCPAELRAPAQGGE
ncbi:TPA: hypothetical protein NOE81_004967 [Pseudomonas aeruginosa]|nr:hypothetical protein [Pseudomonas aeruginosa]